MLAWDPQAAEVHKIPKSRVEAAPRSFDVDAELYEFLLTVGGAKGQRILIPVGWNVGSFDMPFVRDCLPRSASLISRRYVDLNSVCFTLGGSKSWQVFKKASKEHASLCLSQDGYEPAWHDALYDAQAAMLSWAYLVDRCDGVAQVA